MEGVDRVVDRDDIVNIGDESGLDFVNLVGFVADVADRGGLDVSPAQGADGDGGARLPVGVVVFGFGMFAKRPEHLALN